MRSSRRVTQRVAPALASIASVLLFATCDFDKISGTPTPITQQEIDRLFSITPADTTIILGGTTALSIAPGTNVNLTGTTQSWSSSNTAVVAISETGVATGVTIGNAVITARLIAPELDTGYSKTRALRVRYKGIKACGVAPQCSPSSLDSIAGLNLSRPVSFFGTNNADARQTTALTGVTLTTRDSGAATNTVASVTGSNVLARRNGAAYVIGVFENMRDSIKVRVRQVAKSLTFPTTDYTVNHLNLNRTLPITVRDVNDSVMTSSPIMRWAASDTSVIAIDSLTGILRVKKRDTARIFVRVDTIIRSQKMVVDQKVATLRIDAGNTQTDTALFTLPVAPKVTALDSGSTPVPGVTVTFRLGAAGKSAGSVITDSVKITDANGQATLGSWTLGHRAGLNTVRAVVGTDTSTLFQATATSRRPSKLAFGLQPRATAAGVAITPAVTVTVQDSLDNVTTVTDSVSIAIGSNPSGAALGGTKKVAAVSGTATFNNLTITPGGPAFTLAASSGGLTGAISNAFDVYGTATKLGVSRQPVATSAGAILDTIEIVVLDANNATIANATNNVTLAIANNAGGGSLTGTTTVAAVNGVARFIGLSINNAGNGYTLQATATGLTPVTTSAFNVNPVGTAAKLAFITQPPASFASGSAQTVAIAVQDANGATVGSSSASVTISLVSTISGASLSGTLTRNAVNGVATFTGVSVNKVGAGLAVLATSSGLTEVTSTSFSVTPGAAAKLAFLDQPTHTVVSTAIAPAVRVAIQDANDNIVTTVAPTSVSLSMFNCTGPTLSGTTSANTASGIASFSALSVGATTGISCRLSANATGLTSGGSDLFSVVSTTGAIRLSFGTEPSNTTAGNSISTFTVRAVDQSGAVVTTATPFITLSVLSGPGSIFSGQSATASSGTASFSSTQIRTAGTYRLLATATGFKTDTSATFTISAASLSKLGFVQQPANITAGVPFAPAISVAFQDTYGNTVTSQTSNITVDRNVGPFGSSLSGGATTVAAQNGVATFEGLTIKTANGNYNLFASTPAPATGAISNNFSVAAGPATALGFTSQPPSFQTAGDLWSVTVQAQDSVGNVLSNFNNQVTLALTGGSAGATLIGTATATPTSGSATFNNLSVQKAGTGYQLNASASGLSTGQSNTFTVSASSSAKLGWLDQIQNTVQKAGLDDGAGNLPRVAVQDQYGNTTNTFFSIQIAIGTNPGGMGLQLNGNPVTSHSYSTGGDGIIELTGLSLSGSGNGVTLLATLPGGSITSATSNAFNVAAFGSAAKLAFKTQPSNGTYAVALNPTVEVRIEDDFGNTVTDATNAVTLAKSADPSAGAATLGGGGATAAIAGVATFGALNLDRPNTGSSTLNGYSLQATSPGLTPVTSNTFSIASPGFVTSVSNIADMTRVGDRLYWIEVGAAGSLKSVSTTGGAVTTHAGVTIANAARIGTDGVDIFWSEGGSDPSIGTGSIRRYNVASATATTLVSGLFDVRTESNTFSVDAGHVYFHSRSGDGLTASIRRVATNVVGPTTPTNVVLRSPNNTFSTQYFTVSGGFVYYFDNPTVTIKRVASDGSGTHVTIASAGGTVQRLVLAGNSTLYFSEGSNIRVLAGANTLAGPGTIGAGVGNTGGTVYSMIVEGNNLYIKTGSNVHRYTVTDFGGSAAPTTIAVNGLSDHETLLLDSSHIYWSTNSGGIGKIVK